MADVELTPGIRGARRADLPIGAWQLKGARFVDKADCPGCVALRDDLGRYPIGFCGPDCERRKARDEAIAIQRGRSSY